ncbi:hypothetical protein NEOLEDRAFT_1243715 [Neolentinus lepideus HHB14362 ss-1]|uniref:PH domain-like protein n=1 Tax=Neolentinus lepideus HHB14362 ss-1 TaxID=1314782 RepID=A0A165QRI2_9AGAM|nr:hypothetical protein NEOLEDRAFT_1243715 [Neolentinus lepideus HHB14362 ss-1]
MAPRRPRSISHASQTNHSKRNQEPLPRPPTQPPQPSSSASLGMSAASRYQHNLKVLRRRDPSILSIFDQFSHVCLYHHNGKAWEKKGFEGSMFLFEREAYPPYGFYILNRMGMEDYIQAMYPEDDMEKQGNFLLYRSYPDYTAKRLGVPASSLRTTSEDYSIPEEEREDRASLLGGMDKKRGSCLTVGFWMHATDAREHLTDVMLRLHPYVQRGLAYPPEYRYGPDRPPGVGQKSQASPELQHLATTNGLQLTNGGPAPRNEATQTPSQQSQQPFSPQQSQGPWQSQQPSGMSELDQLFAKATPTVTPALSSNASINSLLATVQQPAPPPTQPVTGKALLDSIFASVGGTNAPANYMPVNSSSQPSLDALFASVAPNPQYLQHQSQPTPPPPEILSPKPTSSTLPQILNQDVISSLLGLSSRASSARPSHGSRSSSAMSGSSSAGRSRRSGRYEGDNESSGGSADGLSDVVIEDVEAEAELELSESSTVLDGEDGDVVNGVLAENGEYLRPNGSGAPHLSLYTYGSSDEESSTGITGDATPRPPLRGIPTSPKSGSQSRPQLHVNGNTSTRPSIMSATSSMSTVRPTPHVQQSRRPSVAPAFDNTNGVWDERSFDVTNGIGGDVVELDFADTSALSDPEAFSRRLAFKSKNAEKGKGKEKEKAREGTPLVEDDVNEQEVEASGKNGDKKKKHGRRERELLKFWHQLNDSEPPAPMVNSTSPSPVVNGGHNSFPPVTGVPPMKIDKPVVGTALLDVLMGSHSATSICQKTPMLDRKEFVQELLTLIYSDKEFVDKLWQDYNARCA